MTTLITLFLGFILGICIGNDKARNWIASKIKRWIAYQREKRKRNEHTS